MKRGLFSTIALLIFAPAYLWAQITATATGTNASNCSNCNGKAKVTVTGGTPPYTYNWSNGATASSITGLCPGIYSVTVIDNLGNSSNTPSVTIGPLVQDSVKTTNTNCSSNTGTADVYVYGSGTPPYTYSWSTGATTTNITGLSAGTYYITITDHNGCTAHDSAIIAQPVIMINIDTLDNTPCGTSHGDIYTIASNGTAPYTYSWSNGATTRYITGLSVGNYTVTVTDANGCSGFYIASIPGIALTLSTFSSPTSCNNVGTVGVVVYSGNPPFTYAWSPGGATTAFVTGLSAGTYSVTVTDATGCSGNSNSVVPSSPLKIWKLYTGYGQCVTNSGKASVIIQGGVAPYTYQWSNGGTTDSITGLSAGTYKVIVRDKGGCKDSATVNIAALPVITYVNTKTNDMGPCNGTLEIVLSPNAKKPVTYTWYSILHHKWMQSVTNNDTIKLDSLCQGWYPIDIVADTFPCTLLDSAYIYGPNSVPEVDGASPQISIYPNPAKGVITVEMKSEKLKVNNDGIEIYNMLGEKVYSTFNIQNSTFKIDISSLPAGQYMLRVYNQRQSITKPFEVVK